ncbi:hypothetical protein [Conchiformibius kuhniae]|uniref:Lipoprotein n=1 Tax=Conchiformibius kuhniae TaxID=211502 RepID=A0A8T9MTX7_9NEIS|nr:hypothetical protein [Conchiformibius kuhniae]UOP04275.1 hypothetical protein LVJ77_07750 [Conchiformibius kuhniae]
MKTALVLFGALALGACTWETYRDAGGQTRMRPKYPAGSGVFYSEGAASQNPHYHGLRPQPHVLPPNQQ